MSSVGPQLPPSHLEKRKRENDGHDNSDNDSSSDSDTGPAPPPQSAVPAPKKARVIGPSLPPPGTTTAATIDSDDSNGSSDEDDFGPSLPPTNSRAATASISAAQLNPHTPAAPALTAKRDDWMMVPPTGGDWTARVDPTKLKNRKFNTGKGAKGPASGSGASDSWHETPQEKQARLQREMMGIKDASTQAKTRPQSSTDQVDAETAKRLREYNKSRGPSLYDTHQNEQTTEQDDDPSARAFDREKDIGGGLQINATQRRDMIKKASDFSSRFSSARYL